MVGLKSVVKMGAEGLTAAMRQTNRQLRDNESSLRDRIEERVGEDGVANAVSTQAPFAASGNSLVLAYSSGATVNMAAAANAYSMTGSLVGIESARQRIIGYMNDLDTLADAIRDQVNAAHGYSAGPSASGVPI